VVVENVVILAGGLGTRLAEHTDLVELQDRRIPVAALALLLGHEASVAT
jgi:choline kinase